MGAFDNPDTAYSFVTAIFFFVLFQTIPHFYTSYIGNQFLRTVSNSDLYRNIFLILSIWFVINYIDEGILSEELQNSLWERLVLTIALFVFILLFSRQEGIYNAIELLLLFIMYVIYQVKLDDNNANGTSIEYASYSLLGLTVFIMFIGYYRYMMLKMKQKGRRFTLLKFVFGKRELEYSSKAHSVMH